jgi:hypothetical protein
MNKLTMNTQQLYNYLLLIFLLVGWIPISQAYVKSDSEASIFDIQINPSAGSIDWLNDWEIESAAEIKSSAGSEEEAYDKDPDGNGETSVDINISGGGISAAASADASIPDTLNAHTEAELTSNGKKRVIKFADSTLAREFKITGGTGDVEVQFSYQYQAQLMGEADECGHFDVEYVVNLEVTSSDNTNRNMTAADKITGTNTFITQNYSDNLSDTLTLTYDEPYRMVVNVDSENDDTDDCGDLVELLDFKVTTVSEGIKLEWATATEQNNAGFHLHRSEEEPGEYIKITDALIESQGDGATYTFVDKNVKPGVTYYYKLEDIDRFGNSTFQYPTSSGPNEVLIIEPASDVVFTINTLPKFKWRDDRYNEFKFQFSDDNGQTFHEIPADRWMEKSSFTPQVVDWQEYAKARKGQVILWRVVGRNEHGQAFSEVRRLTIE